jgi:hypothetical protein
MYFRKSRERRTLSIENGGYRDGLSLSNSKHERDGEAPAEPAREVQETHRSAGATPSQSIAAVVEKYLASSLGHFRFTSMKAKNPESDTALCEQLKKRADLKL